MRKIAKTPRWGIKLCFIALIMVFGLNQGAYAGLPQTERLVVKGKVYDELNDVVAGATVRIKGTTTGTITNVDGEYNIVVPQAGSVLQFSFIGFAIHEATVNESGTLDIVMQSDVLGLDEVVVVGYGVQQKSHLTGSISRLKDDNLAYLPVTSLDQALQGKISGLSIQNTTSEAGVAPQIRVRGMGSISASNEPLVVVDGFPTSGGLSSVEMADVESVEVLKDAASAAIYGSRGANGVILITTKSGDIAKPKYTFNVYQGFKDNYKLQDMMNYEDVVRLQFREAEMRESDPEWFGNDPTRRTNLTSNQERSEYIIETQIYGKNTDWQKEGLRDLAHVQNYQFNVSGGTREARYFISANVNTDQGAMKNNQFDKYSLRAKLDAQLSKRVSVGINMSPSYTFRERPSNNYTDFYRFRSWLPVRHTKETSDLTGQPIGSYSHPRHYSNIMYEGYLPDGEYWTSDPNLVSPWSSSNNNPTAVLNNEFRKRHQYRVVSNSYINIELMKGLDLRASQGVMARYEDEEIYAKLGARRDGEPNQGTNNTSLVTDFLSENTLNYQKKFNGGHNLGLLAGVTYQKTNSKRSNIVGNDFPTDDVYTLNWATSIDASKTSTYKYPVVLASYLARVNYNYLDKYLLAASIRTDGSSLFGADNRWSWFPSVSLGWRMTEESFMDGVGWINQLKPRVSYGVTGNNDIEAYAYTDNLYAAHYPLGVGNNVIPGLAPTASALGNPAITWERTFEYNYGVDLSMLNSRINFVLDYYYSITDKLLFKQSAMAFTGHDEFWNNIGKIRNQGLEVELSTLNIKNRNFQWMSSINFATNDNKLLELGGELRQLNYGERNEVYASIVGDPAIQFFGYKTDGVWLSDAEVADAQANGLVSAMPVAAGGLKIVDTNGDGRIDADDRVALGSPFPDFTWGFANNLKYKSFDLSILIQGVQGVDLINGDGNYTEMKKQGVKYVSNRWVSPSNPGDGKTPYITNGANIMLTDYVVEDGSFMALREVVLGYKLSNELARRVGLNGLRVYGSAQNLLYVMSSDYRGINPESRITHGNYSSPLVDGYQRGGFPIQRTFAFGVELTF